MKRLAIGAACALALFSSPLHAQSGERVVRIRTGYRIERPAPARPRELPSADGMVSSFEAMRPDSSAGLQRGTMLEVFRRAALFPRPTVDSLLDGLETIAASHPRQFNRDLAVAYLANAGSSTGHPPIPGAMRRLHRAYAKADAGTRFQIVRWMPEMAERSEAVAFLRRLAGQTERSEDFHQAPREAVHALARLGAEGSAALREMHRARAVTHPDARAALEGLARNDFRIPRGREGTP